MVIFKDEFNKLLLPGRDLLSLCENNKNKKLITKINNNFCNTSLMY